MILTPLGHDVMQACDLDIDAGSNSLGIAVYIVRKIPDDKFMINPILAARETLRDMEKAFCEYLKERRHRLDIIEGRHADESSGVRDSGVEVVGGSVGEGADFEQASEVTEAD